MGGIIGKLSFERDEALAIPALEQMLATLQHRGPLGRGIFVAPGIALGWCGGDRSPITSPVIATNEDDSVRVVADTNLTNAAALRRDLERRGHRVHGRSDADLIAHAYEEWGDACVEQFRGPFACAVWDARHVRLLLARDSMGIRPLFFSVLHGHGIVFASEIRALLQDPGVGREWCPQAIDAYLALGYVPAPLTAYQRISKLEPAQRLIVEGRRLHVERYWTPPAASPSSDADVVDALADTLTAAVRSHLADPDVTAALYSGGIASTTLLAHAPRGLDAVLVSLLPGDHDVERRVAAARRLGAAPRVELAQPDATAIAPQLAASLDEPLADPAAVSHFAVMAAARLHGSKALAGYGATALLRHAAPGGASPDSSGVLWDDHARRELYTRRFAWQIRDSAPLSRYAEVPAESSTVSGRSASDDVWRTLPDNTLAMAERVALAAGIELQLPYLDPDVVALACRCRPDDGRGATPNDPVRSSQSRVRHGSDVLVTALSRRLPFSLMPPDTIASRRPEACLEHSWLPVAVNALVPAVLLAPRFDGRGIVSRPVVRQLWEHHAAGRADHSLRLWSLLMLEFWFREFIDGDTAVDEPYEYAILRAA